MPRRVRFVGRDVTDPKRPRLVYETDANEQFHVPEEMLKTPMGAEAAAAEVGGYAPQDPGPESGYTTADTFVGYRGSAPVYANQYDQSNMGRPEGPQGMRAPVEQGGQNSRLTYGPPSEQQMAQYGTAGAPPAAEGVQGVPQIAGDMVQRATAARQRLNEANQPLPSELPQRFDAGIGEPTVRQVQPQYEVDIGDPIVQRRDSDAGHAAALKRLRMQLGLEG